MEELTIEGTLGQNIDLLLMQNGNEDYPVFIGVGAAYDYISTKQARTLGEWLIKSSEEREE